MKLMIFWLKASLFTLLLISPILLFAQGPGFDDDVEDTPIDGGATMILAAAAGYGAKKLMNKKNNINTKK